MEGGEGGERGQAGEGDGQDESRTWHDADGPPQGDRDHQEQEQR